MSESSDSLPQFLNTEQRERMKELFRHQIRIVSCLLWRNAAPWRVGWRKCSDVFLLLPIKGSFYAHVPDRRPLLIAPGRFLLLPEAMRHSIEVAKKQKHLHQIALHFHINDSWKRSFANRLPKLAFTLDHPEDTIDSLCELACLMERAPETGQAFGTALVQRIMANQLRKHDLLDETPTRDRRITQALKLMDLELESPNFSVEELASSVNLTPVQFRKIFRRDVGESPKQFLQTLRLRQALWLLQRANTPIKQIASQCGFGSDHYFHLAFRQKFGKTPSQYRIDSQAEI